MTEQQGKYNVEELTGVECVSCHKLFIVVNCDGLCEDCYNKTVEFEQYKKPKKEIPDSLRWAVWERDNFTCQKCGSRRNLSIDHVYPESKGGELTMENCQTLCKSCNSRKGAK